MARVSLRFSRRVAVPLGLGLATATIAGLAIAAPGFDARRTPVDDGAVWAMQSGENLRYARVNLEIAELDIVKRVDNPSALVQSPAGAMILASNYSRYAEVTAATSADLTDDAPQLVDSPSGTESVSAAGEHVAFHTSAREVYVGALSPAEGTEPRRIDREQAGPDGELAPWSVDALTVNADGLVAGWSAESRIVSVFDVTRGEFRGDTQLGEDIAPGADAQITLVGERWALVDAAGGTVILSGRESEPVAIDVSSAAIVQQASTSGDDVLISDENGLHAVALSDGTVTTIIDRSGLGVPAAVTELNGVRWAAWLAPGASAGTLWRSDTLEQRELAYAGAVLGDDPQPVFQSTGARMALNDTVSGWVWTVPDGELVLSSQDWTAGEQEQEQDQDQEVVSVAVDPKPPVVVDDSFGVRAGASATLPVLLNDSDPNGDVLTIVPSSLEGLDPGFAVAATAAEDQSVTIRVAPGATGSARFTYRAEDGTADGGLVSESAAVVTVTVVPEGQNSPPVWCGVDRCTAERPAPQVGPGSSVEFDWLRGWVDPDGDPLFVSRAEVLEGNAVAAATDAGRVLVQHTDPNDPGGRVRLELGVSDVRGAETLEQLDVVVSESPQIAAQSFAVIGQAGSPLVVDLSAYVSGGSGPLSVVSALPAREGRGEVVLNQAASSFTFTAAAAGSYVVDWTVTDGVREQTASARITLRDVSDEKLSVAPVIAFVRPQEDATIDVFPAVSNPAGHVLLISDVSATPVGGASLFASTVGREFVRVSGSTANLQPGLLGEVAFTVSDGTGNATATADGTITVYLLPVPPAAAPIAVDDAVVVRAGERADVPVLDNDVAVLGNAIAFDPRGTDADAGLAFTTTRNVRLLAPDEPGTYAIRYTIYSVGYPALTDVGTVQVTVLPSGANAAPVPAPLLGRVVSGGTVTIPFRSLGIDPDGDEVMLDSIVEQPERGAARISADGTSIVYTSVLGDAGEVSFPYRVRDALGQTGDGVVRIGVLAADEDPSPIAYSDYVQVTLGEGSQVVVRPLENDVDPARTTLSLLGEPVPNVSSAEGFEAEYQSALDRIASIDDGAITFSAGSELGTFSYFYDVANEFGDVSRGTIVVRVVRESVVSNPVVADTVLTAETRQLFAEGVDVVSGRVTWPGGAVEDLSLELWNDQPGVSVSGRTLSGELPDRRLVIPFSLTGVDFLGNDVESYGFLIVPGPLDLPPTLRTGVPVTEVKEREQVTIDLADLVVRPSGTSLTLQSQGVRASGQRSTAECTASGELALTYVAGEDSPWRDFCIVPVRFEGQESWTHLSVPVRIVPGDPQPELRSASVEVSPGAELTYDLRSMTTWQGDPQDDVVYSVGGSTSSFDIQASASTQTLTIRGLDAAVPGTVEVASIGITNPQYDGVLPAGLTLRVGPAPSTLPKGGTVTQECSASGGVNSCTIRAIGVAGEVNPLPRTPLELVSVENPEACPTVSFSVASADAVTASWTQQTPGAVCSATFVVRDAQGRESAADRVGTVILDFQGLPAAAASVSQVSYGDQRATLAVSPGSASSSYPPITGFEIVRDGAVVTTCSVQGVCPDITDLENGAELTYEAYAINAVGRSLSAPSVVAWSYVPPPAPVEATFSPSAPTTRENWGGNLVDIEVSGISSDTARLEVRSSNGTLLASPETRGDESISMSNVDSGSNTGTTLTITAVSKFRVPNGASPAGGSLTLPGVHGVGAPTDATIDLVFEGDQSTSRTATVTAGATSNGLGSTVQFFIDRGSRNGSTPSCPGANSSDWGSADERVFTIERNERMSEFVYAVCARSVVDGEDFGFVRITKTQRFFVDPGAPTGETSYAISSPSASGTDAGTTLSWTVSAPTITAPEDFEVRYTIGGVESTAFALTPGVDPGPITARFCESEPGGMCSEYFVTLTVTGDLPGPASVTFAECVEAAGADPIDTAQGIVEASWNESTGLYSITMRLTGGGPSSQVSGVGIPVCEGTEPEPEPEPSPDGGGTP